MRLFGGVIPVTGITFLMFCIFAVLFIGYALGRITIKGVCLGDAGVFVVALLFGALCFAPLESQLVIKGANESVHFVEKALEIIESLGLIFFVTSVGFIAGPKFFGNMKKNFKSYVLLGLIIIIAGGLAAVACIMMGEVIGYGSSITEQDGFVAMIVGLLSGSLTSTPAAFLSASNLLMCSSVRLPTFTFFDLADAFFPAFLPNTIISSRELPISLFLPWIPPTASPAT